VIFQVIEQFCAQQFSSFFMTGFSEDDFMLVFCGCVCGCFRPSKFMLFQTVPQNLSKKKNTHIS